MLTNSTDGSSWYLLQCKPRQDDRAQINLLRQNYDSFRPQLATTRLIRGKPQRVCESLFPGYLFIRLSQDDNWGPIRSTRGVSRFVEFNRGPAIVADDVIEQLQLRCLTCESTDIQALEPGQTLQITRGPLSPLEGVFLSKLGAERVMLLLQFLNREQCVCVPLRDLALQQNNNNFAARTL
ncbi:transcription/translation regulatory transformer protein RfaH [Pseudomonas putida]|uniref:Transcription/translation regulatory transformer protein RfaH n=1 Tax=Pseudomonas putida TaxID=303 RepID=A0A2Z4RCK8_PSEPU|nr:transcription/translation regulatory transformer protein RfaH [Pseudomonas putida]AWY38589.1 transcription/translation regulatory transformer protein RfaH [Pseudomonas putida]